jgi:adenylate kinase
MDKNKNFFIMIGRSGSGKGTQAELIKSYFENVYKEKSLDKKIKHITTGGNFRELIESDIYTAKLSKEIVNTGGLMPEFLAIWNWANIFVKNMEGDEDIILDGAPRKLIEMQALDSVMNFYGFKRATVVYIDVTKEWAIEKLEERGREDDKNRKEIDKKMEWFENDVKKVIEWYSEDPKYNFIHVNGEREIQDINTDILKKINNI